MEIKSSLSAITFYQYSIVDRPSGEICAVLTVQDNTPVCFDHNSRGEDQGQIAEDPFEYIWDLRIYEPEFYGEIAQAIASEMIDITNIKFMYRQSFQVPFSIKDSKGSINDVYGPVFDDTRISHLFTLTRAD
jgi:hypothetical protein